MDVIVGLIVLIWLVSKIGWGGVAALIAIGLLATIGWGVLTERLRAQRNGSNATPSNFLSSPARSSRRRTRDVQPSDPVAGSVVRPTSAADRAASLSTGGCKVHEFDVTGTPGLDEKAMKRRAAELRALGLDARTERSVNEFGQRLLKLVVERPVDRPDLEAVWSSLMRSAEAGAKGRLLTQSPAMPIAPPDFEPAVARYPEHVPSTGRTHLRLEDVSSALIIRREPLEKILGGRKTWEMRGGSISKRGTIGLIEKGSKTIVGVADLVDCRGPLTDADMYDNIDKHGIEAGRLGNPEVAKWRYAWVLTNVRRLQKPVPYKHTAEVQWVKLDPQLAAAVRAEM